jgi:nitroreductase
MPPTFQSALTARYRTGLPAALNHPAVTGLLGHRSVRSYDSRALPEGTLQTLIAGAQSAATSSDMQAWSVVAVSDEGSRGRLAEMAGNQNHIRQCPLFLVWLADLSRATRVAERAGQSLETTEYLESFVSASIDAALAAQNAVVAAEAMGLGTVYIGAIRNRPLEVAEELGLPLGTVALFGLCVGFEDAAHPAAVKPRLPQSVVLHHNRYSTAGEAESIAAYDEASKAFQSEQGQAVTGWSSRVVARYGTLKALGGRHELAHWLTLRGLNRR